MDGPGAAKRPRTELTEQPLPHLDLASKIKEALFWGGVSYGHPNCLLPPPPPLARAGGIPAREAASAACPPMPPAIARVLRRWVTTSSVYAAASLERNDAPPLREEDRIDLVERFIAALPKKIRETPLSPEFSSAGFESEQLRLGRRYGPDNVVPYCCNNEACASLKIRGSFSTPLQRYYTPLEDDKLQRDPSLIKRMGTGPCLICIRHDCETLVKLSDGKTTNPMATYGQPYAISLRIYNTMGVPGGYKKNVFSSTPVDTPQITPIPIVSARCQDLTWQYTDGVWYVDQRALVWNPGQDF